MVLSLINFHNLQPFHCQLLVLICIDKIFCPNFIADDTDINRPSSNQETAVCCETKNGSEKNDGKKIDESFGPKFISDDTDINGPYPHQETAVGCVTKNDSVECDVKKIDVNFHGHQTIWYQKVTPTPN